MSDLEERTVKISVIIPLKNEVKFLQDCLDSLEDQTCKDFEAIIVCAGSKAEDVEAVKSREVSFPVKVVVMEGDVNVAMARNEGTVTVRVNLYFSWTVMITWKTLRLSGF